MTADILILWQSLGCWCFQQITLYFGKTIYDIIMCYIANMPLSLMSCSLQLITAVTIFSAVSQLCYSFFSLPLASTKTRRLRCTFNGHSFDLFGGSVSCHTAPTFTFAARMGRLFCTEMITGSPWICPALVYVCVLCHSAGVKGGR